MAAQFMFAVKVVSMDNALFTLIYFQTAMLK